MAGTSEPQIRYELARNRARGLLTLTRQRPPVDVQAIIDLDDIPVVERASGGATERAASGTAGKRREARDRAWAALGEVIGRARRAVRL